MPSIDRHANRYNFGYNHFGGPARERALDHIACHGPRSRHASRVRDHFVLRGKRTAYQMLRDSLTDLVCGARVLWAQRFGTLAGQIFGDGCLE